MKKYFFAADRYQLEKSTEPKYIFNAPARTIVYAEDEAEAAALAETKLEAAYFGTGVKPGKPYFTKSAELPVD